MMWSNSRSNLKQSGNLSSGLCLPSSGTKPIFFFFCCTRADNCWNLLSQKQTSPTRKYSCSWDDSRDKCKTVLAGTRSRNFSALDPPDLGLGHQQRGLSSDWWVGPVSWLVLQSFDLAGANSKSIEASKFSLLSVRIQATKYHRVLRLYSKPHL